MGRDDPRKQSSDLDPRAPQSRQPLIGGVPELFYVCHVCGVMLPTVPQSMPAHCRCGNIFVNWVAGYLTAEQPAKMGLRRVAGP